MTTTHDDELLESIINTVPYSDIPDRYNCKPTLGLVRQRELIAQYELLLELKNFLEILGKTKYDAVYETFIPRAMQRLSTLKSQQQENEG